MALASITDRQAMAAALLTDGDLGPIQTLESCREMLSLCWAVNLQDVSDSAEAGMARLLRTVGAAIAHVQEQLRVFSRAGGPAPAPVAREESSNTSDSDLPEALDRGAFQDYRLSAAKLLRVGVAAFDGYKAAGLEVCNDFPDLLELVRAAKGRVEQGLEMISDALDPRFVYQGLDVLTSLERLLIWCIDADEAPPSNGQTISPVRGTMEAAADLLEMPEPAPAD